MSKDLYILEYSEILALMESEEVIKDFYLTKQDIENPCLVNGRVISSSRIPLEGVTVKLFSDELKPVQHKLTRIDGTYQLYNIPSGNYILYAISKGYKLSIPKKLALVSGEYNVEDIILYEEVPIANVFGIVKNQLDLPVPHLTVHFSLIENDRQTLKSEVITASDGEYFVTLKEFGEYVVDIFDQYHKIDTKKYITVSKGTYLELNLTAIQTSLTPEGTINGVVRDVKTYAAIGGAQVALYQITDEGEKLVDLTYTNDEGKYFFGYVVTGKYLVKARVIMKNDE